MKCSRLWLHVCRAIAAHCEFGARGGFNGIADVLGATGGFRRMQPRAWIEAGLFLAAAMSVAGSSAGAVLYGMSKTGDLFTVDEVTGVGTLVCTVATDATEFEYDRATGSAFVQAPNGSFTGAAFDIDTCALSPDVPNGHSFTGLEYVGGVLYGVEIDSGGGSAPSEFRTLDPATGVSVLIGPTGVGAVSGLAYDPGSGAMYGIAGGPGPADFYSIDLGTGVASVVGNTGMQAGSLEFASDGKLFAGGTGANAGELWEIDPVTGAGALVGSTGFGPVTGLALRTVCGDGTIDSVEQCDDGNASDGDCCSSTCQMPTGCSTDVDKGLFLSKEKVAGKEKLVAKLLKGPALVQSDFGDPLVGGGTAYHLCVWDDSGNLVGTYQVDRAGDLCSGASADCWKPVGKAPPDGKGFKFSDKDGASGGVQKVILKGGDAGKSKALIKGKGSGLPEVAAALEGSSSVTLQLHGSDAAECLETTLTDIKKADPDFFKAK